MTIDKILNLRRKAAKCFETSRGFTGINDRDYVQSRIWHERGNLFMKKAEEAITQMAMEGVDNV